MEIILYFVIFGLLVFIVIRINDIHNLFTKKSKKPVESELPDEEPVDDEDYTSARDYVISTGKASTSSLQTIFRWGYNKAARITNDLERYKIIGPVRPGERYREVLIKLELSEEELKDDEDYMSAKDYVITTGKASIASLQTAFRWGYNKAARITNDLERCKIIGPARQGEKYREVLVGDKK